MSPMPRYETAGYGDFSFGRLIDRADIVSKELFFHDPKDVRTLKPAWAQRYQTFPFLKLPPEVRRNVFRMILEPLYMDDMETIHLRLSSTRENPQLTKTFAGDYVWYLESRKKVKKHVSPMAIPFYRKLGLYPLKDDIEEEEPALSRAEYEAEKKRLQMKDEKHPSRGAPYRLEVFAPPKVFGQMYHDNKFDLYVEWIRQLCNTSTLIRKEFGELFWLRVVIMSADPRGLSHLQTILNERPLVHKGLKHLDLLLDLTYKQNGIDWVEDFPAWCVQIGNTLVLDTLTISLRMHENDLNEPEHFCYIFPRCSYSRFIPVKYKFDVFLFVEFAENRQPPLTETQKEEKEDQMRQDCMKMLRNIMTPWSLRGGSRRGIGIS